MPLATQCRKFAAALRRGEFAEVADALLNRIVGSRAHLAPQILEVTRARTGLEIGGPSTLFGTEGALPVYTQALQIDNVNFTTETAWEHGLRDGGAFQFSPKRTPGTQFLREATNLAGIEDDSYDFVLSSHCLEHVANPLAALHEWRRVTRPGGWLVLALPDPRRTFDHRRPVTPFAHLREDFARSTGEDDLTHLEEILAMHDLDRDTAAGTVEQFRARSRLNAKNRCLHHHVFNLELIRAALAETGWTVEQQERVRPLHLLTLARKMMAGNSSVQ